MNTVPIVVILEVQQFVLQITNIPEGRVVKILPPNGSNEAFDEGMRERHTGHGFHLRDIENPQIRLPTVKLKQRIVIAAEVAG